LINTGEDYSAFMFGVTKDPLHSKHLLGSLEVDWAVELSSGMAVHNAKQNENNI